MQPIPVQPTLIDREVASVVVRLARPVGEKVAQGLTWGADEHVLIGAAAVFGYCRAPPPVKPGPRAPIC